MTAVRALDRGSLMFHGVCKRLSNENEAIDGS